MDGISLQKIVFENHEAIIVYPESENANDYLAVKIVSFPEFTFYTCICMVYLKLPFSVEIQPIASFKLRFWMLGAVDVLHDGSPFLQIELYYFNYSRFFLKIKSFFYEFIDIFYEMCYTPLRG